MPNLVLRRKIDYTAVTTLLEDLNVDRRDTVKLTIQSGFASAHVKRADGRVQSASMMLTGQFRQMTAFEPSEMSPSGRRRLVKQLDKQGLRQTAIANLIGVSQATVSLDLAKIKGR
ncbi:hypothetical protein [Mesorhizobium sp.]|uniref:hypothetical protein n=1 Tax=Mesorhizobium sp. TaxID=1871066 RepID=UPI00121F3588|nr:hypothetical protein [Mesorhizobium sp.]TIO04402.1 MAG: hypothetical protein E5X88_32035 [Mesorhizobium sp.]TIO36451.1 MAG: hypothetical protein E5X89_00050 [Mesorhizobium sp.]